MSHCHGVGVARLAVILVYIAHLDRKDSHSEFIDYCYILVLVGYLSHLSRLRRSSEAGVVALDTPITSGELELVDTIHRNRRSTHTDHSIALHFCQERVNEYNMSKNMIVTHGSVGASYSRGKVFISAQSYSVCRTRLRVLTRRIFFLSGDKRIGSNEADRSENECNSSEAHDVECRPDGRTVS
ncbi:hypothetical protein PM082_024068 [Marasmius tenuissimus]|nr:hypothetical protein PM082_024068 [Marasmius tenuissimus]